MPRIIVRPEFKLLLPGLLPGVMMLTVSLHSTVPGKKVVEPLSAPTQISETVNQEIDGNNTVHPIFCTKAFHGLEGRQISDDEFKQFAQIHGSQGWLGCFARNFSNVEDEALEILSKKLRGYTKKQTEKLIGSPIYKRCPGSGWNDKQQFPEIWLYEFGVCKKSANLYFQNDTCKGADIASWNEMNTFTNWRYEQIRRYAIGKNGKEAKIEKEYQQSRL